VNTINVNSRTKKTEDRPGASSGAIRVGISHIGMRGKNVGSAPGVATKAPTKGFWVAVPGDLYGDMN